jgi:outer membrane biosynthesis protein TonB
MSCRLTGLLLLTALAAARVTLGQQPPKSQPKPVRVSPRNIEKPKVDAKLLQHGTSVTVHAMISKTGEVTNIRFVKGNADLMPEVLKAPKTWKYKPYVYKGHPVEVESTIFVNFDPLTAD